MKVNELAGVGNHNTALYWEYDTRLARRWNLDPKDQISISNYAVMANNPISLMDLLGDKPTPKEASAMAAHVYGDKKDDILVGGWHVSKRSFNIQLNNKENGLKSQVYERTTPDGVTEYTYATAGTELEWGDVGADVKQPIGLSSQYKQASDNAKIISAELSKMNSELTFTGHSLGGGEAANNAYATGRDAITFNAAGVGLATRLSTGTKRGSNVDAYIMTTDPLNKIQNNSSVLPDVNGVRHYVKPPDLGSYFNGHSMDNMLKVFKIDPTKYAIPKPPPPRIQDPSEIHNYNDFKREATRWMNWKVIVP